MCYFFKVWYRKMCYFFKVSYEKCAFNYTIVLCYQKKEDANL